MDQHFPRRAVSMNEKKHVVLVAHDNRKQDLLEWVRFNQGTLAQHQLFGTGTTGALVEELTGLQVTRFISGPLGGDQQIGAKIVEGAIDMMVFFWDPLAAQPHDPDVKALLRIAVLYNIPVAMNRATADFLISSHLLHESYERLIPEFTLHRTHS